MRKIKNFVIGGIQQKVFNLVFFTLILVTVVYSVVILRQTNDLNRLVTETNAKQRQSITDISRQTMDVIITQTQSRDTQMEAMIADNLFQSPANTVRMLAYYAGRLFDDPESYTARAYALPNPTRDGEVSVQLLTEAGVDIYAPEVATRLRLVANLSEMLAALYENADISACYIALPEGVMLLADDHPSTKYDEKGALITFPMTQRDWYVGAAETGDLFFTDVVSDVFTGQIGIMCGMPVYHDGELVAVVGADLFLDNMAETVASSDVNSSFTCIVNENGHVVFSPKTDGIFQVKLADDAPDLRQAADPELADFVRSALQGFTGVQTVQAGGESWYMTGAPIKTVGWTVINVVSMEAANQPTAAMEAQHDAILNEAGAAVNKNLANARRTVTVLLIVVILLAIIGAQTVSKRIVKPLEAITGRVGSLGGGDLQFRMEDTYRTGDEIQVLAEAFADLSAKTLRYVDQVQQVTAEKERIGAELSLATRIQASMLPHIFPAFPERNEFDIYASMNPAKEVGGDFYDYFLIDDDHLAMVIADVSGKGVPAALFMMASKIILQSVAMMGKSPAEILERTNQAICSNNEAQMFVTVWLGILELSTGKLTAANAGHEYPAIKPAGGRFDLFRDKHGFVIGGTDMARYREYELQLTPGSMLFVYTDGVPEATDAEKEMFGTKRMVDALNAQQDARPYEVMNNVRDAVDGFVKDAEQFDDLTMLCLEYKGPSRAGK